jgi:hypothetical protein
VLVTKCRKLGKLGVRPNDPLLQTPVGPRPSNAEMRKIRKDLVQQPRKRKLGDDEEIVVLPNTTEYTG